MPIGGGATIKALPAWPLLEDFQVYNGKGSDEDFYGCHSSPPSTAEAPATCARAVWTGLFWPPSSSHGPVVD